MKRVLALLLVLCGAVAMCASPAAADITAGMTISTVQNSTDNNEKALGNFLAASTGAPTLALGAIAAEMGTHQPSAAVLSAVTDDVAALITADVFTAMTRLDLSGCTAIQNLDVSGLMTKATALTALNLKGCSVQNLTLGEVPAVAAMTAANFILPEADDGTAAADMNADHPNTTLKSVTVTESARVAWDFSYYTGLETLTMTEGGGAGHEITLTGCTGLKKLDLTGATVKTAGNNGLTDLDNCEKLEELILRNVATLDAVSLAGLTSLVSLDVSGAGIDALATVTTTARNTSLRSLNASGNTSLNIVGPAGTGAATVTLANLSGLRTLNLAGCTTPATLTMTGANTLLETVILSGCTTLDTVTTTGANTAVKTLNLAGCNAANLAVGPDAANVDEVILTQLTGLETFILTDGNNSVTTVRADGLKSLSTLDLTGTAQIATLTASGCTSLKNLELAFLGANLTTLNVDNSGLTELNLADNTGLTVLRATANELTKLSLSANVALPRSNTVISGQTRTFAASNATFDFASCDISSDEMTRYVRNVKDGNGNEPSSTDGTKVTFAAAPSKITYDYLTNLADDRTFSMDITLTLNGGGSGGSDLKVTGDSSKTVKQGETATLNFSVTPTIATTAWKTEPTYTWMAFTPATTGAAVSLDVAPTTDVEAGNYTFKVVAASGDVVDSMDVTVTVTEAGSDVKVAPVIPESQKDQEITLTPGSSEALNFTATGSVDVWYATSDSNYVTVSPATSTNAAFNVTIAATDDAVIAATPYEVTIVVSNDGAATNNDSTTVKVTVMSKEDKARDDAKNDTTQTIDSTEKAGIASQLAKLDDFDGATVATIADLADDGIITAYQANGVDSWSLISADKTVKLYQFPAFTLSGLSTSTKYAGKVALVMKLTAPNAQIGRVPHFYKLKDVTVNSLGLAVETGEDMDAEFLAGSNYASTEEVSADMYVASVFTADGSYGPTATSSEHSSGSSSSGGCDAGFGALALALVGLFGLKRK